MGFFACFHLSVQVRLEVTDLVDIDAGPQLELELSLLALVHFDLGHFTAKELLVKVILCLPIVLGRGRFRLCSRLGSIDDRL